MADSNGKSIETEPTFDLDEFLSWFPDTPSDLFENGMGSSEVPLQSSSLNYSNQQPVGVRIEENCFSPPSSNPRHTMRNPMYIPTEGTLMTQNNLIAKNTKSVPPSASKEFQQSPAAQLWQLEHQRRQQSKSKQNITNPMYTLNDGTAITYSSYNSPAGQSSRSALLSSPRSNMSNPMYTSGEGSTMTYNNQMGQSSSTSQNVSKEYSQNQANHLRQLEHQAGRRLNNSPASARAHPITDQRHPQPLQNLSTAVQEPKSCGHRLNSITTRNKESLDIIQQATHTAQQNRFPLVSQQKMLPHQYAVPNSFVYNQKISENYSGAFIPGQSQGIHSNIRGTRISFSNWVDEAFEKVQQLRQAFYNRAKELYMIGYQQEAKGTQVQYEPKKILEDAITFMDLPKLEIAKWRQDQFWRLWQETVERISKMIRKEGKSLPANLLSGITAQQPGGNNSQFCGAPIRSSGGPSSYETNRILNSYQRGVSNTDYSKMSSRLNHLSDRPRPCTPSTPLWNVLNYSGNQLCGNSVLTSYQTHKDLSMAAGNLKKDNFSFLTEQNGQLIMQKTNDALDLRNFTKAEKKSESPQSSHHSSGLTDLSSKVPKSMKLPECTEKSLLSIEKPAEASDLPLKEVTEPVVVELPDSPLPLPIELNCPSQTEANNGDPLTRLVNVVKSMSSEELSSSVQNIYDVTMMNDMCTRAYFNEGPPSTGIVHDLTGDIINYEDRIFSGNCAEPGMKRQLNDIYSTTELCSSSGMMNTQKKTRNNQLLVDIKQINQNFIEVVLEARAGPNSWTSNVTCTYHPIEQNALLQTFPDLILEMTVDDDYPFSAPTVVETLPSCYSEALEGRDIWVKAMSKFNLTLRKSQYPISLQEMANSWDLVCRELYYEFAERNGGSTFSSHFGHWEILE